MGSTQYIKTQAMNQLKYVKMTKVGKHYRHKITSQQRLLIQYCSDIGSDFSVPISLICQHLYERKKYKNSYIPQILQFHEQEKKFCQVLPGFNLWMVHPLKSLHEQIQQRIELKQPFQQGQIWMIAHSVLSALLNYENLGMTLKLSTNIIFISLNGEIIVSDAHLYASGRFLSQKNKKRNQFDNIKQLISIIYYLTNIQAKRKLKYSNQLLNMISNLEQKAKIINYQKAINEIIVHKQQLQKLKPKIQIYPKQNLLTFVESQYLYNEAQCKQKLSINALSQIYIQNQQNKQNNKYTHKINNLNQKFYRTTPINTNLLQVGSQNFSMTLALNDNKDKTWKSVLDLSSINQEIKQIHQRQEQQKQSSLQVIDRLFDSQKSDNLNINSLSIKNKQFLQALIMKQKNMIPQVPESDYDLESVRSFITPSRRVSILSINTLNTIPERLNYSNLFNY